MAASLRIGELSRRTGVTPELLRAWERRYGLLRPERSRGGFRLYSDADERRIRLMLDQLAAGVSAAEAARAALDAAPEAEEDTTGLGENAARLREALDAFDERAAHAALDRLLSTFTLETVLRDVVLPYLAELGDRWQRGEATVTQEHFASNLLRGRLLGLARGWGRALGPRAVLACAPGELHDLALIAFGLVLHARGWRIAYLGPDTPVAELADAARALAAALVVVSASAPERLAAATAELEALAREVPLALAGAGATRELAAKTGADVLASDPVTEAERVALPAKRAHRDD
jgi:DNA-binding transcriptional MerR regulator